jgi:predicted chitinase
MYENISDQYFADGAQKVSKRSIPVSYQTAQQDGVIQTLEGPVNYKAGHKIITGPKGERYPIPPEKFAGLYDDHGDGTATPKKIVKLAKLADHDGSVKTSWGETLNYRAGEDYIVRHGDSDYGVVKKDIFAKTYQTEGLEEGPVWDRVKRTAATGAVATGLGYAALTGPTDQPQPIPEPAASTTQQVAKAPEPAKAEPTKSEPDKEVVSTMMKADPAMQSVIFKQAVKSGLRGAELAQFMGQVAHETMGFNALVELGDKEYFKQYDIKHNPGKAKILGNVKPGDGVRYKGRGFLQITGRENYREAGKALGLPLEKRPELAERPDIAAKVAVWYWKSRVRPGIENWADTIGVTQKINPGMAGLGDRDANFHSYAKILQVATQ